MSVSIEATEFIALRACRGDAQAFAQLIARYERVVLAVAFAIVKDGDLAGDVAQETFLRAWRRLSELKRPAAFERWVCEIARNLAADYLRKQSSLRAAQESLPIREVTGPEVDQDAEERRQRIAEALAELDETTRAAVVLRYYEGLSSKRIGEALGLSAAAVDMRLSRGREQLRQRLRGLADDAEFSADAAGEVRE